MKADALPALDVVPEMLRVWIHLTEGGAVQFLRQVQEFELENAGTLQSEQLPRWIKEYFTCLHVWGHSLKAALKVSVDYSAAAFPKCVAAEPATEMQCVWEL